MVIECKKCGATYNNQYDCPICKMIKKQYKKVNVKSNQYQKRSKRFNFNKMIKESRADEIHEKLIVAKNSKKV